MVRHTLISFFISTLSLSSFSYAQDHDSPAVAPAAVEVVNAPEAPEAPHLKRTSDIDVNLNLPQNIVDKLDPKDIHQLLKLAIIKNGTQEESADLEEILVPFIVFASMVAIVFISLFLPYKKYQSLQETVRQLAKDNHPIPDSIFASLQKPQIPTRQADLRKGTLLTFLGIGSSTILLILNPSEGAGVWGVGILPLCIGIAYLILWYLGSDKRMEK